MSVCPAADVNAPSHQCEKHGCRDRASCYHVYWYCERHCPRIRS